MSPRRGFRWCSKGEHWRAERFFKPKGRTCFTCLKKGRSKSSHAARVQNTYGLAEGEYDALMTAQDGRCAICRQTRRQRLSVDHDHKTGLVRGLCCRRCNGQLLTAARDNPETLRSAANYLEDPPALKYLGERRYQGP